MKRFLEWINMKEKLHGKVHKPPFVSERDIWWVSVGENVGSEINGKSELFSRPAIIFKKLSRGTYLVVPTTTQKREGSWYVTFLQQEREMTGCLHQIKVIDYRRLYSRLGIVDEKDFERIREGFNRLYK